ncbi:MAG TPA: NrfD/PsrC family molybdoenzyme membrane anchor subunit [Anaerolineales bacterium]|nr:NrfD/PsrC family molybdoenzyme membrane anchor subunit [Anaerolineales bacterium]
MAVTSKYFSGSEKAQEEHHEEEHDPRESLMYDVLPRGVMNDMVMESMHATSWKFWVVLGILVFLVATCFFYAWGYMIAEGLGVAGVMRPAYWGVFLVNTVFWIGISHAGTFISAILRVFKAEFRRPFTRAAELMTTFGLIQAGASIFMHLGRVWLAYWMFPVPNERQLWPNFHSPLMWDLLAITTYVLGSTMYLFLPLIPDLAMARDRSTGWRKTFYRILALGFRGTEGEWRHLTTAMNIFAFAIIPVMFSVHTIVSWDFAMAMRPGWSSTVFGPYFVLGALHSGMGAVAIVLFIMRYTMKHMDYFIRKEHFDALGKLMMIVSFSYAYFFFNDYIVQWYGGDAATDNLLHWLEAGPMAWMFFQMVGFNIVIPFLTLWNKRIRTTPWLLALIGLLINVGMYWERYIIVPVMLTINRMPFTWRLYEPRIEVFLTIGTFAMFLLFYMIASRLIPLVPVWEVQEGQMTHTLRKVGKAHVPTISEFE